MTKGSEGAQLLREQDGGVGAGKAKQIEAHRLWVQEKVSLGGITMRKITGADNVADTLAKPVASEALVRHTGCMGFRREQGKRP